MNEAMIYRPNKRKLIWIAFACAITIHVTAIAIAENRSKPVVVNVIPDSFDPPVVGIDENPPPMPQEEETMTPAITDESEFIEDNVRPSVVRQRKKAPVSPVVRSIGIGTGKTQSGSVKTLVLYAPKPNYPYEARRGAITGSGVAQLTVNSATGNVINARIAQSTGSAILDNATLEALKRWRFKTGVAENVDVPITFTLTGVSY
jgi:TonB family protein